MRAMSAPCRKEGRFRGAEYALPESGGEESGVARRLSPSGSGGWARGRRVSLRAEVAAEGS
jgi:hypothetical protein